MTEEERALKLESIVLKPSILKVRIINYVSFVLNEQRGINVHAFEEKIIQRLPLQERTLFLASIVKD